MFVNAFYQEKIFYFVTLPEKQKANVENADTFRGDHWTLYAWFCHLLSCSLIDLFNHWPHRSWEMTSVGQRLVVAMSLMGTTARRGKIILGHAYITSAYFKFGKPQSLQFFLMILKSAPTLERLLLAEIYPKLKIMQTVNWLIYNEKPSQVEQNALFIRTVHTFPLVDTLYGRASDKSDKCFRKHVLTAVLNKWEWCPYVLICLRQSLLMPAFWV